MKVDGTVEYWMNHGGWKHCYTSKKKAQKVPYVVDNSIYQAGVSITSKLYVGKASGGAGSWTPAP